MNLSKLFFKLFGVFIALIGVCTGCIYAETGDEKSDISSGYFNYENEHFSLLAPENRKEIILKIVPELEKRYELAAPHFKHELVSPVKIKVYSDLDEFHKEIGWPSAPDWVRGRTKDGIIEVVLEDEGASSKAIELIIHQITCIIAQGINSNWDYIPAIFWEGMAIY